MPNFIQINTTLETADGGTVAAGSIVLFSVQFSSGKNEYLVSMLPYRSLAAIESNSLFLNVKNFPINKTFFLSSSEFAQINPAMIFESVRAYLGETYGDENVVIISTDGTSGNG
jgi:hypothetical protein